MLANRAAELHFTKPDPCQADIEPANDSEPKAAKKDNNVPLQIKVKYKPKPIPTIPLQNIT